MESGLPLVGLRRERQALLDALRRRECLLLLGPGGSGKTALVRSVAGCELRGEPLVHVPHFQKLHDLLVTIAGGLLRCGHKSLRRAIRPPGGGWDGWLAGQTSVHLKGLLWNAIEQEPVPIILDGVTAAGHPTYRFLQRLYFAPGMAMILTARDYAHLGVLRRLFWDPRKARQMQPLSDAEALQLFAAAAARFGLAGPFLDEFREKALDSAKGNPGQIVEMCRFAADPMYAATGGRVKFAPLRIDVMMRFA